MAGFCLTYHQGPSNLGGMGIVPSAMGELGKLAVANPSVPVLGAGLGVGVGEQLCTRLQSYPLSHLGPGLSSRASRTRTFL